MKSNGFSVGRGFSSSKDPFVKAGTNRSTNNKERMLFFAIL